ncbi:hypothetical protein CI105_07000 [Candidatus Izimaplasma bacterium ZiA1]|uniref:SHOCT domain-containing protein n=1 Tax=Candidatus Izimoplasma sp. ZiA1 TaxID=2024899 RepID=UPI000BAA3F70|nr:hypothetical protein CI105_07000 [Candidatus Izimaplasma bacterium ZiA1]
MMVLWLVIIGVLVYYLINGSFEIGSFKKSNALDKLNERLAKGEISIEEYKKIKTTLKES